MRESFRILDADRHVIEPMEMWARYLEPGFREHAPYVEVPFPVESLEARAARLGAAGLIPLPQVLMLDGKPVLREIPERAQLELAKAAYRQLGRPVLGSSPEGQLRNMDRTGVDVGFLYPTAGLHLQSLDALAPALASALARAYNSWLRDFCSVAPERLRGVGCISLHAPEQMVPELERLSGFGWTAVVLFACPTQGRLLSDAAYAPFWAACEQRSIAVGIHAGTYARIPTAGADRFRSYFAQHVCSHPMEQMMALLALIEGGVLERHPGLRVAFLEAGCGWLPYWLWRMDEVGCELMRGEVSENLRLKPSEYFRRQCFVAVEPGEPYLPELISHIGVDNLILGTDFPHVDHDEDLLERVLALRPRLQEEVLSKLLWSNPARFYGLPA